MMNHDTMGPEDGGRGYLLGAESRVVLHRHASRGTYAVAVVLDEGPYSLPDARRAMASVLEGAGWVTHDAAAERLGLSRRQVSYLRNSGRLVSVTDETGHVLISSASLDAEIRRRES